MLRNYPIRGEFSPFLISFFTWFGPLVLGKALKSKYTIILNLDNIIVSAFVGYSISLAPKLTSRLMTSLRILNANPGTDLVRSNEVFKALPTTFK